MASVEELPPETGAHSEGFATPIGGGLPSGLQALLLWSMTPASTAAQ
eukprot:COSAG06_NODE_52164_length_307_cov_0.995192_1_plen_46_part_10